MPECLLAFDYGKKKIGVAVGFASTGIARPLAVFAAQGWEERMKPLVAAWKPGAAVVGMPCLRDGKPHPLAACISDFAQGLFSLFSLPVTFVDEHLSTREAKGLAPGKPADALAAALILESFFLEKCHQENHHGSRSALY